MDIDYLGRKRRLIYLAEFYFRRVPISDLRRRMAGEKPKEESRASPVDARLLLRGEERCSVAYRTLMTYFEMDKAIAPNVTLRAICLTFVRAFLHENDRSNGADPRREASIAEELYRYVQFGEGGGPYVILNATKALGRELDFEHLMPLTNRSLQDDGPFAKLSALRVPPAVRYLRGGPPEDWSVLRDVALKRTYEDELIETLADSRLIVLTGAAGEGKTTTLKRVAMRLREAEWRVFYCEAPERHFFPSLPIFPDGEPPTVLLIDNADMARGYPKIETDLAVSPGLRIVLCARDYRWKGRKNTLRKVTPLRVPPLYAEEVTSLAAIVLEWSAADRSVSQEDIETRIYESLTSEHPHLLAAMISATTGRRFQDIIEDLIRDFQDTGEDWLLRAIACGSYLSEGSSNRLGRIPYWTLAAIIRARVDAKRGDRQDIVGGMLRKVESEIVPVRIEGKSAATEYDLRHPDIWRSVLRCFYGYEEGAFTSPETFATDILEIGQDEISTEFYRQSFASERVPYIYQILRFLLTRNEAGLSEDSVRFIVSGTIGHLGNYPFEARLKYTLMIDWAVWESGRPQQPPAEAGGSGENPFISDQLFEQAITAYPEYYEDTWLRWIKTARGREERRTSTANADGNDRQGTVRSRDLCRSAWEAGVRSAGLRNVWFDIERTLDNPGNVRLPALYSARWIARQDSWVESKVDYDFWADWFTLETELANYGAFSPELSDPFSSRWIARTCWLRRIRGAELVTKWLDLEQRLEPSGGDFHSPAPFTIRSVCRTMWQDSAHSAETLLWWASFEAEIGMAGIPEAEENTARWIFRAGWDSGKVSPAFVFAFAQLEKRAGKFGDPRNLERFTARWIYSHTCDASERWRNLRLAWFEEELALLPSENDAPLPATWRARLSALGFETWISKTKALKAAAHLLKGKAESADPGALILHEFAAAGMFSLSDLAEAEAEVFDEPDAT